jgi:hypothetical protein
VFWVFIPSTSWLWWNVIGFLYAFSMGIITSLVAPRGYPVEETLQYTFSNGWLKKLYSIRRAYWAYYVLILYFFLIIGTCWSISQLSL